MEGEATENTDKVNSKEKYLLRIEFRLGMKATIYV
jgi:hypothetical protein